MRQRNGIVRTILPLVLLCMAGIVLAQEERTLPTNLEVTGGEVIFNSSRFQAGIRSETNLGTLARQHAVLGDQRRPSFS
jgi:hypothetical protein